MLTIFSKLRYALVCLSVGVAHAGPIVYNAPTNVTLGGSVDVLPTVVAGGACVTTSNQNTGISTDRTTVYTCVSNQWRAIDGSFWKSPVADYATLAAIVTDPVGTARLVTNIGRIFSWNGASWVAAAIDQNGNLSIPGNLTVTGATTTNGSLVANGTVSINGSAQANGGLRVGNGTPATSTNTLVIDRTATEGSACSPNGSVARDANGLLLSCQSGSWRKASSTSLVNWWRTSCTSIQTNAYTPNMTGFWSGTRYCRLSGYGGPDPWGTNYYYYICCPDG